MYYARNHLSPGPVTAGSTRRTAGLDGFTVDLLNVSATGPSRKRVDLLIKAAEQVAPDMTAIRFGDPQHHHGQGHVPVPRSRDPTGPAP